MIKILIALSFFLLHSISYAQSEAEKIVLQSIKNHDPNGNWQKFNATVNINSIVIRNGTVDTSNRKIFLNLRENIFEMSFNQNGELVNLYLDEKTCFGEVVSNPNYSSDQLIEKNITCERAKMYNDYYQYLIGLPMKLKDNGTIIHPQLNQEYYKGIEYNVVTVTYDPKIGNYTWKFYFDKRSSLLILAEFSKDGSFLNGETIEFNNKVWYQKMLLPGQMVWYVLPDRPLLAEENITYSRKSRK